LLQWRCCWVGEMSLQAIVEAIRAAGEAQALEIERQARSQAGQILTNARMQADTISERACAETVVPAARERARIIHRARLEALRQLGHAREALVDAALDQVRGRLAGMRGDDSYPLVFKYLTEEALSALNLSANCAPMISLQADPRDRVILEAHLHELGSEVAVDYDVECWGGAVARSDDNRIVVINTLESRIEKATPYLRRYLAALFEGELITSQLDQRSREVLVQ
jgi:vacuolar-type H+-ATPase subunit E/Vma4